MPTTLCLEPRCPSPAVYRGRCQRHQREYNRETTSLNKPLYNKKRWKILRKRKLHANSICERCENRVASEVHHKQAIQAGGDPWKMDNLEALCRSCHSQATRKERATP